jgi:hypothetical protein
MEYNIGGNDLKAYDKSASILLNGSGEGLRTSNWSRSCSSNLWEVHHGCLPFLPMIYIFLNR